MIVLPSDAPGHQYELNGDYDESRKASSRRLFGEIPYEEVGFTIFALVLAASPDLDLVGISGPSDPVKSDPREQAIWLAVYGVFALMIASYSQGRTIFLGKNVLPYTIIMWAAASLLWSSSMDVSFKRLFALLGSTLIGTYIGCRFTPRQLFTILLWVTGLAAVLSLFVGALGLNPASGGDSAWQGIFAQKNWLGRVMALSTAVWIVALIDRGYPRKLSSAIVVISVMLLVLSDSAASLVTAFVLTLSIPLLLTSRLDPRVRWAFLSLVVSIGSLLSLRWSPSLDSVLDTLDRDTTFTGRSELWEYSLDLIGERPWTGYGYGGFWLGWQGPSEEIWRRIYWHPPHAHNGFYDLLLELGWIGMILFLITFLFCLLQALREIAHRSSIVSVFPVMFLIFLFLSNLAESNLLTHNSIYWIVFLAITLQLANQGERPRHLDYQFVDPMAYPQPPASHRSASAMQTGEFYEHEP